VSPAQLWPAERRSGRSGAGGQELPYLVHGVSSGIVMLPYLWEGPCEKAEGRGRQTYLTVVPAISATLKDPAYGGDDAENARDPVAAVKNPDRLNYTRGSGAKMDAVGRLVGNLSGNANLPGDTKDPKNRWSGRGESQRAGDESHM
jgi:hypothetical protein